MQADLLAPAVEPFRGPLAVVTIPDRVLQRHIKDHGVTEEEATLHAQELARYLSICARHRQERWPMVASIDGLWHTFIIFTRDYHDFCISLGVPYLHHEPISEGEDHSALQEVYARFLTTYRQEFGEPPIVVWPKRIDGECGGGDCENNCVQCR